MLSNRQRQVLENGSAINIWPSFVVINSSFLSRFLLLACDGLWKGFEVDEALKYINDILKV